MEVNYDVQAAEAAFKASKDSADIDNTLEIACPREPDCDFRFELYLKDVHESRLVKNGLIGKVCILNTLDNRGNIVV